MAKITNQICILLWMLFHPQSQSFYHESISFRNRFSTNNIVMNQAASTAQSEKTVKRKKVFSDRTQAEAVEFVQDIGKAALEAGRIAPARTLQAYVAFLSTVQDFSPFQPMGRSPQTFSSPKALRVLFERLGATYIKLGQFIASSPTLFPAEYVVEFQKCLDKTEALEWSVIKKVIETELGPIHKTFKLIDKTPLASASIAQVHSATLRSGEEVVIKVQKPGIGDFLKADLNFIYIASRTLEFLQPDFERTSLSGISSDIRQSMLEELDFEKEARNVEEFRYFLAENQLESQATAPKVYREYTTKKVMTMERLNGVSLLDIDSISKITSDPEMTIITALNVWTTSVMKMPWFHADVHAGNLLVLKDGKVGFIDFGIVGRVSPKTFQAVNELSTALSLADYRGMAQALCNMGATDEEVDIDQFAQDIQNVLVKINSVQSEIILDDIGDGVQASIGFDEGELTQLLLDFVNVAEDNGLRLPREFGLLVKQSLYFDRYLKILAPNLDVVNDSRVDLKGEKNKLKDLTDVIEV